MDELKLKKILEAVLMTSESPLSIERLQQLFDDDEIPTKQQLLSALNQLTVDYQQRAIELKELASGYSLQTRAEYGQWVARLSSEKPVKYSSAILETLAIIAYRQPVTRADIENIRGVTVSTLMIRTLLEREWIRVAGYRDVPGKPAVYVTTKLFLDYFNLKSLNELPAISAVTTTESENI
ncbi:MAG: SMC-Scp complex subunit ScpB [Legionella sp.]